MAPPSEKSTMSCQERPSASAGHVHSSVHSCSGTPESSSLHKHSSSYPGVYMMPAALSTSLSDKSMVGEESHHGNYSSSSVYEATAASESAAWQRSDNNSFATLSKSLTALGMSGHMTSTSPRAFPSSQSNREDSSNRLGADCCEELQDCSAGIGDHDWTQFMNTGGASAFFSNSRPQDVLMMLPSTNSIAQCSPPLVGRSHGAGNGTCSSIDGAGPAMSPRGHPAGSGHNNIANLTPTTGNTWSTLNASSCQSLIMDPSTGGIALQQVRLATSQPASAEFGSDLEFPSRFSSLTGENICSQRCSHSLHALADGRLSACGPKLACHAPSRQHCESHDGRLSSTVSASLAALRIPSTHAAGLIAGAASKHPGECTFEGTQGKKAMVRERPWESSAIQLNPVAEANLDDDGEPGSGLLQVESVNGATDITTTAPIMTTEYDDGSAGQGLASCAEQAGENNNYRASQATRGGLTTGLGKRKFATSQEKDNNLSGGNLASTSGRDAKLTERTGEPTAKRFKCGEGDNGNNLKAEHSTSDHSGESSPLESTRDDGPPKPPERHPKQDYIHVRARRGQATDSHSLAERVRREKISERMKFLQDLVPGCNKVTGKAVMLDEIINYVQSLQHQVEFLSMKLAAVNPRLDFHLDSIFHKMLQSCASPPTTLLGSDHGVHHEHPLQGEYQVPFQLAGPCGADFRAGRAAASEAYLRQTQSDPLCSRLAATVSHGEPLSQTSSALDGELQSVVQMGFKADWSPSHGAIKYHHKHDQSFTTPWRSATSHSSY
ncbi:hypothetical protein BDL97_11G072000 [Sphagnum fallax]|nr:hypothetical protein BDL97_11G072000 [Sphagnum fallax]KAH8947955.1 hypothetical protein BDL97_11G072000 [Sphagnum fallax]KAH8947956.1 hypothetical protein BDL97_11G072000 [Sphagnum fallax]